VKGQSAPSASLQVIQKLTGVVDTSAVCATIQRDLNRLEKWADRNLMKFNNRIWNGVEWSGTKRNRTEQNSIA